MFFLFWFGSDLKEDRRPGGFFDCPRCGERQPCDVVRVRSTTKLYSILPVWTRTLGESLVCRVCGARVGDAPPSFAPGGTWRCPSCGNVNPAKAGTCLACGAGR